MPMTRNQILAEALALAPADREAVAQELLLSLSDAECDAIEQAWLAEARRRDAAFARGQMGSVPVDDAIARVLARKPA